MDPIKELRKRLTKTGHHSPLQCLWSDVPAARGSRLSCYAADGKLILLQEWEHGGWDIYVPASTKNDIEDTMVATTAYLTEP